MYVSGSQRGFFVLHQMKDQLLFRVTECVPLTGLGVLLLGAEVAPLLASLALHTALALTLRYSSGRSVAAVATVEEVARPGELPVRALLLTQEAAGPVPVGTEVWWSGTEIGWEQLF